MDADKKDNCQKTNDTEGIVEETLMASIDQEYSIWEYFKKNIPVLLAVISVVTAFLVFVFKLAEYLKFKLYMDMWGINISQIRIPVPTNYYSSLAFFIKISITSIASVVIVNNGMENMMSLVLLELVEYLRREGRKVQRELKSIKKKTSDEDKQRAEQISQENEKQNKELNALKNELRITGAKKYKKTVLLMAICILLLNGICDIVLQNRFSILVAVIIVIETILIIIFPCIQIIRTKRKLFKKIDVEALNKLEGTEKTDKIEDVIKPYSKLNDESEKRKGIDNPTIKRTTMLAMVMLLLTVLGTSVLGSVRPECVPIVCENGVQYVIVYNVEDTYYLIESKDNSGTLNVLKNKQKIIKEDALSYEMKTYSKIIIE